MSKQHPIPGLKGRPFNGKPHLNIKRVRQEPRQKIRQLLRSFEPLNRPPENAQRSAGNWPLASRKMQMKIHQKVPARSASGTTVPTRGSV